jgi:SAM-dependent methyltransferase
VYCRRRCVVYTGWTATADELAGWYGAYHPNPTALPELTQLRLREVVAGFEQSRLNNVFLDYGCGDGYLLDAAMAAGWSTAGVEVTESKVESLKSRGIDAMAPESPHLDSYDGRCDVVAAVEVLEHLTDPLLSIERWLRLLRPGGVLYLTTPNFDSLSRFVLGPSWRVILFPEHLTYFTVASLQRALRQAGLRVERVSTTGASPQRLLNGIRGRGESYAELDQATRAERVTGQDRRLRELLARSAALRGGVSAVNMALGRLRVGDTLKATARR